VCVVARAMFFCQASQFAPVVAMSDNVNIYDVSPMLLEEHNDAQRSCTHVPCALVTCEST
jgi:hypothetical protein